MKIPGFVQHLFSGGGPMGAINLGPFSFPISTLLLLGALLVGFEVARKAGRAGRVDVEPLLWKALLVGVLAARIAFLAAYFDLYRGAPWSMFDIRDGGFFASAGILAAAAMIAWRAWREREGRKPLLLSVLAGGFVWMMGATAAAVHTGPTQMPQLVLTRLDGSPFRLEALKGKPVVLNLWATWCPPCRREMPALRDAQMRHPDVSFVFANQGEAADAVRSYLDAERLALDNVLLDPRLQLGSEIRSPLLPTTLFFNAQGKLVDRRMGELSAATLEQRIEALRAAR
jgi:thiol-disulfide isomerase/thioredoxin